MSNGHDRKHIPISRYDRFCAGSNDSDRYVVVINVAAASVPLTDDVSRGSAALDGVVAFDLAETRNLGMGQLNLMQVSSFCGPAGLIWGYDLAKPDGLRRCKLGAVTGKSGARVPIFDAAPLMEAAKALIGTSERPVFPIRPGSLCPAAYKSATLIGPGVVYAGFALGIVEDRSSSACIFMEDCGSFAPGGSDPASSRRNGITGSLAQSVISVVGNQRLRCREVFVAYDEARVRPGEVGCALAAVPYISLAKSAVPPGGYSALSRMSLARWRDFVSRRKK